MHRNKGVILTRSPTHKSHPNSYCGELDEGEVVGVVLFIARGDGSEVFEFIEEALDEVAVSVEEGAERRPRLLERAHPCLQIVQEGLRLTLMLEAEHDVIRITDDNHVT